MEIDISRPPGVVRPFRRAVTLSGQRYQLQLDPSARGGGWYLSIFNVMNAALVRSIGLRVTPDDMLAPYRARIEGLPPLALRLVGERDPGLHDLSTGVVRLLYGE